MEDRLWRWSAIDLAHAVHTRKISSRETPESCLGRLEGSIPRINAVVDVMAEAENLVEAATLIPGAGGRL